ncbi:hypothetical protein T06_962, partial [Trichinella sp. T6]
ADDAVLASVVEVDDAVLVSVVEADDAVLASVLELEVIREEVKAGDSRVSGLRGGDVVWGDA